VTVHPWLGILLYVAAIGTALAGLRIYQQKRNPHPEWVRKLAHMWTGLVTLSLPWLFQEALPVVLLAALSIALLFARRLSSPVKQRFGDVLDGVARSSGGEIYFPLSVAVLFVLARGSPVLFCIPILILTFADAVAALAGVRYGQIQYQATEGHKSAEGSIAFFTVAFLSTHIPLLLLTDTGRVESVLIGLVLGFVAMLLEAVAWRGLDNLFIPLGGFVLLKSYLEMDIPALAARFAVTLVLVILVFALSARTTLNAGALLGAAFVGYVCWSVGGWKWLAPPLVVFLTYTMLSPRTESNTQRIHNVHAVFAIASAGLLWMFFARAVREPAFYYPYTLSFAAHLAMIGIARLFNDFPYASAGALLATSILKGWLLVFAPYYVIQGMSRAAGVHALAALGVTALAAFLFYKVQPGIRDCPIDRPRWLRQAGVAALSSAAGLVPVFVA